MNNRVLVIAGLGVILSGLASFSIPLVMTDLRSPKDLATLQAYQQWKLQYGKLYASPSENDFRLKLFSTNLQHVNAVNKDNRSYRAALNEFSDLSFDEVRAKFTGLGKLEQLPSEHSSSLSETEEQLPASKDWGAEQTMNPVEHQRSCGSCYAWSTAAALEHGFFRRTGKKILLSKQELVDCTEEYGNEGCTGGWMHNAFDYIIANNGLQTESTYPYLAIEQEHCHMDLNINVKSLLYDYKQIKPNNPEEIKRALMNVVVPSAVDARDLVSYSSGVFDKQDCSSMLNHAIVIVGYGEEGGKKYWKVRNSWGPQWGEQGHFKLLRNDEPNSEGICGITKYNIYPTF